MEGLGAAASVIAVASLALQLAESVTHLCEFWQSITDAPESVRDIAKELHVLSTILASIANTALPERQIDMKLVLETSAGFQEQRLWRNAMTHLVTDDRSHKNVVGEVFSDINLPPMCGPLEEINEKRSHEIQDLCHGVQYNITSNSRTKIRRRRTQIAASYTGISSIFGNLTLRSQTFSAQSNMYPGEEEDEHQTGESYLTIRPALWLARFGLKYGIRVAISQSPGNWKHVLNTFRPVSDNSLIFEFCKLGNIDGVRLLLDKGEASTWDTNSKGRTPLHVAAAHGHPRLCKVLLEVGADAEARDDTAKSCFNIACGELGYSIIKSSNKIDILRLFIHQADLSEPKNLDWISIADLANGQGLEYSADSRYMPGLSSFTWVVKMLKESIRENVDVDEMAYILWGLSLRWSNKDMKVLADFKSPKNNLEWTEWTPLHYCVWFQDYVAAHSLVQQGAKLHSTALEILWGPVEESPTSISMYSSAAFLAWRQLLEDEQLPLEKFITQELRQGPLKSQNWDKWSLTQLFTLNLKPAVYPDHCCEQCESSYRLFSLVEIAWQDILQQFNPKKETMDLLDDLRLMDDSSSFGSVGEHEKSAETTSYSGINLPDIEKGPSDTLFDETPGNHSFIVEWVCVRCWHKMLGTPGAGHFSNGDSDTSDEKSDKSDSDGDDSSCDDSDDEDRDSSSDDSPFLLPI
ncbi:ankyrin [Hyaloscypha variabilis F]|uniref:Ankyrin n=1 Tax=Hyaloscypha variabilis (strain UAMH 11265 / GT02V1 / F) TaxID=1149755 RepID=A0A2J6RUT6_HYAVF|nr:ankyrin [Hyaloscypha variabilis F]